MEPLEGEHLLEQMGERLRGPQSQLFLKESPEEVLEKNLLEEVKPKMGLFVEAGLVVSADLAVELGLDSHPFQKVVVEKMEEVRLVWSVFGKPLPQLVLLLWADLAVVRRVGAFLALEVGHSRVSFYLMVVVLLPPLRQVEWILMSYQKLKLNRNLESEPER